MYLILTLSDDQKSPWGGLHITIIGEDSGNTEEMFSKIGANFNRGYDSWNLSSNSKLKLHIENGRYFLYFISGTLDKLSQQLVESGFKSVKGPYGNSSINYPWHISLDPNIYNPNHDTNIYTPQQVAYQLNSGEDSPWNLKFCYKDEGGNYIWNRVRERKVGFDFDGVIHVEVEKQDDDGSRSPINHSSYKNRCFKLICDKIKEYAILGNKIYIITARSSSASKQIIINNLKHCEIEPFMIQDNNIIMLGSKSKAKRAIELRLVEFYDDSMKNIEDFISNIPSIAPPFRLYKAIPEDKRIELIFEL
jgi:hypothetical protein